MRYVRKKKLHTDTHMYTYLFIIFIFCLFLDDMPPGQTPHTVILYAHNDLVDSVQPGDR